MKKTESVKLIAIIMLISLLISITGTTVFSENGKCIKCDGKKDCHVCGGSGRNLSGNDCSVCSGTGKCYYCSGTGKSS